jgi:hypothetical protein
MKYIKTFEDINIPIKIGDTILGGRFKNKKIVVKKIGKNKKGDITVNDKPLLKYRIIKESISEKDIKSYLAYLIDDGFVIKLQDEKRFSNNKDITIYKEIKSQTMPTMDNLQILDWNEMEMEILPFIELYKDEILNIIITVSNYKEFGDTKVYSREIVSTDKLINGIDIKDPIKITIILK